MKGGAGMMERDRVVGGGGRGVGGGGEDRKKEEEKMKMESPCCKGMDEM